jgi:hypothetical protein
MRYRGCGTQRVRLAMMDLCRGSGGLGAYLGVKLFHRQGRGWRVAGGIAAELEHVLKLVRDLCEASGDALRR